MNVNELLDSESSNDPLIQDVFRLRMDLVEEAMRGPLSSVPDLDLALAIVKLVHEELEAYGTSGGVRLDDIEIAQALRAARIVVARLGLDFPSLPFRDYTGFHKYWKRNDMSGSWAARREYLDDQFNALENQLFEREERQFMQVTARAVSPRSKLGWADIDDEIEQMRLRFASARTAQDCNAVGSSCVRILELIGDTIYSQVKHSPKQEPLSRDKTKLRFESYIKIELADANDELKAMAKSTVALAHKVKHTKTPTRLDAGIAADSTILLANIIRRIDLK